MCKYTYMYVCIYINEMEHYLAIRKNKIMPFASTWMDLKSIMLIQVSQERNRHNDFPQNNLMTKDNSLGSGLEKELRFPRIEVEWRGCVWNIVCIKRCH